MNSQLFVMSQTRVAMERGLDNVAQQVRALEAAVEDEPTLVFDFAKSIVEAACKRILLEQGLEPTKQADLPKLFKSVTDCTPLLPSGVASESAARDALKRTLGGLAGTIQGLCELRNECGLASHGSAQPKPGLGRAHALVAAQAADAIVGLLYEVHTNREDRQLSTPAYEDMTEYNEWVDSENEPVAVFDARYRPSEVLFMLDRDAYVTFQVEFRDAQQLEATGDA